MTDGWTRREYEDHCYAAGLKPQLDQHIIHEANTKKIDTDNAYRNNVETRVTRRNER